MTLPQHTYTEDKNSITCLVCGRQSYNRNDKEHRYCGFCNEWHDSTEMFTKLSEQVVDKEKYSFVLLSVGCFLLALFAFMFILFTLFSEAK